mgnify:CR=1 FL=1
MSFITPHSKLAYIPQAQRKKILLLSDDCRLHSGVATMSREIIQKTAHHFNWVQLGAAMNHPEYGKVFDLSAETNKITNLSDSSVKIYPNNGYGDPLLLRQLIQIEKPDVIMHFTDPRYWIWLYQMSYELRTKYKIPLVYYTIWDDLPYPFYNKPYYASCDALYCISKQTFNIVNNVLGEEAKTKQIKYIPHGIDSTAFFPLPKDDSNLVEFKKRLFGTKEYDFVVLYNNRNIRRKNASDLIAAFDLFIKKYPAKNPVLVMKTHPIDENGTDLYEVARVINPKMNIIFIPDPMSTQQMNYLYNISDVTVNISSNEGWGLSSTESIMAGTPVINNVTGGLQDQLRFEDPEGNWIDFSPDFPSNHTGATKKHGKWGIGVFPSNRSIQGSPLTPYIFDDRVSITDLAKALGQIMESTDLISGREWLMSNEAKMEATMMATSIGEGIDELLEVFHTQEKNTYDTFKVEFDLTPEYNGIIY